MIAHIAGESVSAHTADRNVLAAIVSANCRYSSPVIPPSSAAGPNTLMSTSEIAMIGTSPQRTYGVAPA